MPERGEGLTPVLGQGLDTTAGASTTTTAACARACAAAAVTNSDGAAAARICSRRAARVADASDPEHPCLGLDGHSVSPPFFFVFTHEESDLHFVTFVLVLQADPN